MSAINYKQVLEQALARYGILKLQRDELDVEMTKQLEFVRATLNMLSEGEAREFRAQTDAAVKASQIKEESLTESIRSILQKASGQFLTVTQVRDRLVHDGFNFNEYLSNPLASVSTTLRRLKPDEVETTQVRGVAAYKRIGWVPFPRPPKSVTDDMKPNVPWKPMKK